MPIVDIRTVDLICDDCGVEALEGYNNEHDLLADARAEGWLEDGRHWYCPYCRDIDPELSWGEIA